MNQDVIVMALVLLIYNGATIRLLSYALSKVDVSEAVKEKPQPALPLGRPEAAADPGAVVPIGPDDTSYSRVAGMIGAVVMAAFFWAVGNVVLYKAFLDPGSINNLVGSLGTFFLGGASLFLPYAFNQLREAFSPK